MVRSISRPDDRPWRLRREIRQRPDLHHREDQIEFGEEPARERAPIVGLERATSGVGLSRRDMRPRMVGLR
jgi:hypothetical protein